MHLTSGLSLNRVTGPVPRGLCVSAEDFFLRDDRHLVNQGALTDFFFTFVIVFKDT